MSLSLAGFFTGNFRRNSVRLVCINIKEEGVGQGTTNPYVYNG